MEPNLNGFVVRNVVGKLVCFVFVLGFKLRRAIIVIDQNE